MKEYIYMFNILINRRKKKEINIDAKEGISEKTIALSGKE